MDAIKHVKLTITDVSMGFAVAGTDTFALKDHIKASGGKWQPGTKTWLVPSAGLEPLQKAAQSLSDERTMSRKSNRISAKVQREFEKTPEGQKEKALKEKQKVLRALTLKGIYHWICCDQCTVLDWQRGYTSCQAHAIDGNSFRVRGALYTGD